MIVANWKMNTPIEGVINYVDSLKSDDVIILPPAVYLNKLSDRYNNIGIQSISSCQDGARTGEISAKMASDFGCQYALIGHSERRHYWKESESHLLQQCEQAIEHQLTVIYCVGENLKEKLSGQTQQVIQQQLLPFAPFFSDKFIVAYEPVWAIGGSEPATIEDVEKTHTLIKHQTASTDLKVLYGGSVTTDNAHVFLDNPVVDGLLIGRASLSSSSINRIIQSC